MPRIFEKGAVDETSEQRFGRRRATTSNNGFCERPSKAKRTTSL